MPFRFVQISDTELGARPAFLGAAHSERSRECLETFREAVELALDPQRRIDAVLISGNLLHTHRPEDAVWEQVEQHFARLAAAEKVVVVVPGSRDSAVYRNSVWLTESLPGVLLLKDTEPSPPLSQRVEGGQVHFYGLAPRPGDQEGRLEGIERGEEDGWHIGLIPGSVEGHFEADLRPKDRVLDKAALEASGLDYIALGGYHEHAVYRLGDVTCAYAGTLEGQDFTRGDLGPKAALIVELGDSGREVSFERVPLARKILADEEIDLARDGIDDVDDLLATLARRADERLMIRFTLKGPLEFLCDTRALRKALAGRFAWVEIRDRTDVLGSALLRRIQGEGTVRGHFVRRILGRIERCERQAQMATDPRDLQRQIKRLRRALRLGLEPFLGGREALPETPATPAAEPSERTPTEAELPTEEALS